MMILALIIRRGSIVSPFFGSPSNDLEAEGGVQKKSGAGWGKNFFGYF